MIWKDGLTEREKNRLYLESLEKWHKWFAWYPVTVSTTPDGHKIKAWLQYIERRYDIRSFLYQGVLYIESQQPDYRLIDKDEWNNR